MQKIERSLVVSTKKQCSLMNLSMSNRSVSLSPERGSETRSTSIPRGELENILNCCQLYGYSGFFSSNC